MTQKQFTQELVLHFIKTDRALSPNIGSSDLNSNEVELIDRHVARAEAIARQLYVKTNLFFDDGVRR